MTLSSLRRFLPLTMGLLGALSGACHRSPAVVDASPRLLDDREEVAEWIEAFPLDRYRVVEVEGVGRFYIEDTNPGFVQQQLARGIPWEPYLLAYLADHIRPGSTVLDVGAHIGSITVPMARIVGQEGRVYAFEPQLRVFAELTHNVRLNELQQVKPLRFAVGAETALIEMDPVHDRDGQVAVGAGGDRVELRPLDSFGFTDVSLIKIDVEGFELEVLKGAEELIRREQPALIIEIRDEDRAREATFRKLEELGYVAEQIIHADYLALPRS